MAVTIQDVEYVAELAHLKFEHEEREQILTQMNAILSYVEKLNHLDTSSIKPTSHVLDLKNVFRAYDVGVSLSPEEALRNAPDSDRGHFTVPKVI